MPQEQKQKSLKRQRKEGTQEFFSKNKTSGFAFNKAPINKNEATKQIKEDTIKPKKRSAFMANLYQDESDIDEMKVLGGDNFEEPTGKARSTKEARKNKEVTRATTVSRVSRLVSPP